MADFPRLTTGAVTQYPSSRKTDLLDLRDYVRRRNRTTISGTRSAGSNLGHTLHQLSAEEIGASKRSLRIVRGSSDLSIHGPMGRDELPRLQLRSGSLSRLMPWTRATIRALSNSE